MSIAFLVLCLRPPTRALNRQESRQLAKRIKRRELAAKDPVPDPSWRGRVSAVIEVRGDDEEDLWPWLENIASVTHGAVYRVRDEEFPFVDEAEATARAKHLLAEGEHATLAKWIRAAAEDRDHASRRWTTLEAIDAVVRPVLARAVRAKAPQLSAKDVCTLAVALHESFGDDDELDELVLAAARNAPKNRAAERAATAIIEERAIAVDASARPPTTTKQLQALFEGVVAGDASATRRFERFVVYERDKIVRLAIAAVEAGYDPASDVSALLMSTLPIAGLSAKERTRLVDNPHDGALARALRDAVRAFRDAAGQRAADFSHARFEEYERYRNDPLVAEPRSRDVDIAMFRGLNDALYGPGRDRPQLPPRIVALICDRRLDDALATYVETFGEENAESAIRDAAEYFAPDID